MGSEAAREEVTGGAVVLRCFNISRADGPRTPLMSMTNGEKVQRGLLSLMAFIWLAYFPFL